MASCLRTGIMFLTLGVGASVRAEGESAASANEIKPRPVNFSRYPADSFGQLLRLPRSR